MIEEITQILIRMYDELSKVQFETENQELVEFRDNIKFEIDSLRDKFEELDIAISKL